jgi:hypothetical protein
MSRLNNRALIVSLFCLSLFIFTGCKKDKSPPAERQLLEDGPLSTQLGKMLNLETYGYSKSRPFWGNNSNELYITGLNEILRIDIAAKQVQVLESSGGIVTGRTNEKSGIVFLGKIDNRHGYYVYNFSNNNTERIISPPSTVGSLLNIADNNIFYYESAASAPFPPCDGFCWGYPGTYIAEFYHFDKETQEITNLENKKFMLFSPDGSQTILSSQLDRHMYVFDNNTRTIIDSSDLGSLFFDGLYYEGEVLHSFEFDVLDNITIKNFNTGEIFRQFQTNHVKAGDLQVSADGTKIYYGGGILNGSSMKILLYDIVSNTQTTVAELPLLDGGGLPFGAFVLADDNTRMVIEAGGHLYIKELD